MGNYNPHAPYIIGQEWVPIRNAHYVPDGVTERGYTFNLDAVTVPVSGAFYVNEMPGNILASACDFISVYPSGREMLTGPVKRVRIPASAVSVDNPGSIDITAGVGALRNPEDSEQIIFSPDTGINSRLRVSFDTSTYAEILLNKRIVDVRVRYQLISFNLGNASRFSISIRDASLSSISFPQLTEMTSTTEMARVSTLSITELNPFWDTAVLARGQRTILPWRFQELNRFRSGASPALNITISNNATEASVVLGFMDLEVLYCEETRILYGGFKTYDTQISNTPAIVTEAYNIGAIAAQLYSPTTFTPGATLSAGKYVVTIYHRDLSSLSVLQGAPRLHALRQYYAMPDQIGRIVRQTTTIDEAFSAEDTDVLTEITLHTSSQIVTGVHPYGTQYGAPVHVNRTATQEIEDNPGTSAQYPQVRFYARRYGNTTVPLTLADAATGNSTVSISVTDFDALDEIVDGWREVNLRFTTPPTFPPTTDDVDWRWSAANELVGNQWQIMVASGPSGSWQPNPTAAATGPATYWAPLGSQDALIWQSPTISGGVLDTTSDAVLIFSQDPPTVTGFAVTTQSQELDTPLDCASSGCIPTGLSYNHLSWNMGVICDAYSTPVTGGWGETDTDQPWEVFNGVANQFGKVDGVGQMTHLAVNTSDGIKVTGVNLQDVQVAASFIPTVVSTGDDIRCEVVARRQDANNYYAARVRFETNNALGFDVFKVVAGAFTTLFQITVPNLIYAATSPTRLVFRVIGSNLRAQIYNADHPEYVYTTPTIVDGSITAAGEVAVQSFVTPGNTNAMPLTMQVDDFEAELASLVDASYEIQRYDAITAEWQTIMLSSSVCPISFDDYEARIGVESQYRMRVLNPLDFAGPWVTASATIPAPGVTIAGSSSSLLVFTTNEQPSSNLAYVMQFEGQPVETFSFPEADTVSLQRLFGRDFFLAVRPLERGGERFSRVILVNNAAIPLPSLANFRGLRDLAWADVSYVCVRDELGNRWFATVIVPEGSVRGDRKIYMAQIDVIQVTNTPSQVDP